MKAAESHRNRLELLLAPLLALGVGACSCGASPSAGAAHSVRASDASLTTADPMVPTVSTSAWASGASAGLVEALARTSDPAPSTPAIDERRLADAHARIDELLGWDSLEDATTAALVFDLETGEVLIEREADTPLKPASNTKLFTTAAALELLGPEHRFETRVYATGPVDERGRLDGDLIVVGQHDFTWSPRFYDSADHPLDVLAARVRGAGIEEVRGNIVASGEFVYDGFRYDTFDPARDRREIAKAFRGALLSAGVSARGSRETRESLDAPEGATTVAEFRSVPLGVAIAPINRVSHNEFADALMRHIGWVRTGESSYRAGADEIAAWLATIDIDTEHFVLHDGSGLSHDNRVTARQLTSLVAHMTHSPNAEHWERSLSVAGEFGTYAGRMRGEDTRGRVFVKSGTLDGVISTSGFLRNRHDGHTYAIALLMNDVEGRKGPRAAQNKIVEALADDLRGLGPRPLAPTLGQVTNLGGAGRARVSWTAVEDADGYWIWLSEDGHAWTRHRYLRNRTAATVFDRPEGERLYVRLSAVSADGAESDPSDTYAVRVDDEPSTVLVVDGNDRWQTSEENTWHGPHAFAASYGDALGGLSFDTVDDELVRAGLVNLSDYRAVIWAAGEEGGPDQPALLPAERQVIEEYLGGGGNLLISGSEIAFDLASDGESANFCASTLRATCARDDARTYFAHGSSGIFAHVGEIGFLTPGGMEIDTPDVLDPAPGAESCLEYAGGRGVAAVQYQGAYRLVQLGFPLESVDNRDDRATLLAATLEFFDL